MITLRSRHVPKAPKAKPKARSATSRFTRRSYLRRKPPLLKTNAVVHLDSPVEVPVPSVELSAPTRLHSFAAHGHKARCGVKVPFAVTSCCTLAGRLATGGEDGFVRIWNAVTGEQVFAIRAHEGGVLCVTPFPNGRCFLTGGCDGFAKIWKIQGSSKPSLFASLNHRFVVVSGVVYPDGCQLITLGLDGVAKVWRVENEEFLCQGGAGLSALTISRFGGNVFTAGMRGQIERFSDDGQLLCQFSGHAGPVNAVVVFPNQSRVVTAGDDGQLVVWLMSGKEALRLEPYQSPVLCVDVSPCSHWILSGSKDGVARLSSANTGKTVCSWQLGQAFGRSTGVTMEVAERSQLETRQVQACGFCGTCFVLAGAFGLQVWQLPAVETID